jgi:hypothetical protein
MAHPSPVELVIAGLAVAVTVGSPAQRVVRLPVMPTSSRRLCSWRATS